MIKVSIVVPVYNTEKYLDKCLDSLVNQTLSDIEVIVVNDGTKDNSQMIVDEYLRNFPEKVVSVIQENQGLSAARNSGIRIAKGEYIGFVDSDDWVDLSMFELLYSRAKAKGSDVAVCDTMFVFEDRLQLVESGLKADADSADELKAAMNSLFPAAWNKIYKRSLFDVGIFFKPGIWFEDVEFMYRIFPHIHSISVVNKPLIFYLQRSGAITKTFNQRLFDYLDNWEGIVSYYKSAGYFDYFKKELEYSYVRYILGTFLKSSLKLESKELFELALGRAFDSTHHLFPKYRLNRYFYTSGSKGYLLLFVSKPLVRVVRYLQVLKSK